MAPAIFEIDLDQLAQDGRPVARFRCRQKCIDVGIRTGVTLRFVPGSFEALKEMFESKPAWRLGVFRGGRHHADSRCLTASACTLPRTRSTVRCEYATFLA